MSHSIFFKMLQKFGINTFSSLDQGEANKEPSIKFKEALTQVPASAAQAFALKSEYLLKFCALGTFLVSPCS